MQKEEVQSGQKKGKIITCKGGVGALHCQRGGGSDWTVKANVLGNPKKSTSVGRLGTPRKSKDATRRTPLTALNLENLSNRFSF